MDDTKTDDQIRRFYRETQARLDLPGFKRELAERLPEPRVQSAPRMSRTVRLASYAVAMAVFLVALGFGVNALVERMSQDRAVVVITDDSMSPGAVGPAPLEPAGPETSALTGAKAELWTEIQRIRDGVDSGELTFGWTAAEAAGGDLPSDPMLMLDSLERSLLSPDVTAYLRDGAGEAIALRTEISAMPGVSRLEFVSKDEALQRVKESYAENPEILSGLLGNPLPASLEIWLNDYSLATSLADELRSRPEVDEVQARAATMDCAQWVERLQSLTHPSEKTGEESAMDIVQLTDNDVMDEVPYLQGNLVAWRGHDGHDREIILHDLATGATRQLTDNDVDDWEPKVSSTHVAWMEGEYGGPWSLRLRDLATGATQKVANGNVAYGQYQLKGDLLVWPQIGDVMNNVRVLNVTTGEERTIMGWSEQSHRVHARTDGRYVLVVIVAEGGLGDLLLYDTRTEGEITVAGGAITDDFRYLDDRRLADGSVVWSASDGHDEEIFLYDIASGTTTQLTQNDVSDTEPEVGRGYALWARSPVGADGTSATDREVVLYQRSSGEEIILGHGFGRLAEDGTLAIWSAWPQKATDLRVYDIARNKVTDLSTSGYGASWPDAVEGRVVWYSELIGADRPTAEIMVATRDLIRLKALTVP